MSKFPLYTSLSKDITNKDLTVAQKKSFLTKIDKMDKNGHESMYALIRMYQSENKNEYSTTPYDGVLNDTNINFDLNKFPNILKQILFKFLGIHMKKMKEEATMENTPVKRI